MITTVTTPMNRLMPTQVRIEASAAQPAGQSLADTARYRGLYSANRMWPKMAHITMPSVAMMVHDSGM